MFRDGDGVAPGRIHNQDARACRRIQINVIHADARAADHAQPGRFLQQFASDLHRAPYHQRIAIGDMLQIFLGTGNNYIPAGLGAEQLDSGSSYRLSDQDIHLDCLLFLGRNGFQIRCACFQRSRIEILHSRDARPEFYRDVVHMQNQLKARN
jgi:hypothetical protein